MNTSDLSGNDSSEESGKKIYFLLILNLFFFLESPTQVGDDYSYDEPFMMRSSDSNWFDFIYKNFDWIFILAASRRELYSLGLIDILTYYGMKKKSAHVAKTKLSGSDADGISTVKPEIYARRFLDFVDRHFT